MKLCAMPATARCIEYWAYLGEPGLQITLGRRLYRALTLEGPAVSIGFTADPQFGVTARLATLGAAREWDPVRRRTVSAIWGFWADAATLSRHKFALIRAMRPLLSAEREASDVCQALTQSATAARFVEAFGFRPTGAQELNCNVYELSREG